MGSRLAVDDLPGSRLVNVETTYNSVIRPTTYMKVVQDFIPRFWSNLVNPGRLTCSTHAGLVAMTQEDYNLDINTETVELTYSLRQMAPDLPPIHVTSDRQVRNLLEITKTHEMMRQLHAVYGEWLLKDGCSTHADLVAMAQENYNMDMNTESVELTIPDIIAQRKRSTPKYIGRLFIDRVGIIDGLNPQHIKDSMKNMFGMTLDYTTSCRALLYAQEMVRESAEDGLLKFIISLICSTHADLVAMAQEDYNLDMNTESVELTYSLQQMASDLPPIHVTSDRHVWHDT
ncbi:hypothetical protein DY000_02051773 [Brassica cretica]|uniref:Uncharacterized protein n=1 Tax=Brassica cretica TaxID=69181 RepID=A0ABQ7ABD9_BRACR|nr:hypothetical protein DY000_02051773 [Brassica cretica]